MQKNIKIKNLKKEEVSIDWPGSLRSNLDGLILSWRSNLSSTSVRAALRGQKRCGRKSPAGKKASQCRQSSWSLTLLCLLQSTQHQHFSSTVFTLCLFSLHCKICPSFAGVHHLLTASVKACVILCGGTNGKRSHFLIFTDGTKISSRHLRFNLEAKSLFFHSFLLFLFFSLSCCSGCCAESPAQRDTQEMTAWKSTHTLTHTLYTASSKITIIKVAIAAAAEWLRRQETDSFNLMHVTEWQHSFH